MSNPYLAVGNRLLKQFYQVFMKNTAYQGVPQKKLQEEVDEFLSADNRTDKLEEAADVIILVATQLYHDYIIDFDEIMDVVNEKLAININRKWKQNTDGTISHIE